MRVLVIEFVTGGGLRAEPLPASLAREGAMMRDALAHDLADAPGVRVVTTHDDRVAPAARAESLPVGDGDDVWALWKSVARGVEIAWPIAPETGGLLSRLVRMLRDAGVRVIAPDDETLAVASSKRLTAERLLARGVPTPPVWRAVPPGAAGPWVVKPDDGAGCEGTRFFDRPPRADEIPPGHVAQAFVAGTPASLTVLRAHGRTRLLSANRQHVAVEDGAFRFRGVSVGALDDRDGRLAGLAKAVGDAMPGLDGIFGVDVVIRPDGEPVVIEVNPRLTTAYCGLREALGLNPVLLVPPFDGLAEGGAGATPARPVEVFV